MYIPMIYMYKNINKYIYIYSIYIPYTMYIHILYTINEKFLTIHPHPPVSHG